MSFNSFVNFHYRISHKEEVNRSIKKQSMQIFNIRFSIYTFLCLFLIGTSAFEVEALNAEPILSQTFSDALRDKIQTESRLNQSLVDPHCEFKGTIARYEVNSVAPQPGELTAFNRLDVTVSVEFINHKDETQSWKQTFPYFSDFASDENFLDIQDALIETINEQLVEDIFNKAFTNW